MELSYSYLRRGLSMKTCLEELCTKIHLDSNCWQDTSTSLFTFRTTDYIIHTVDYSCLFIKKQFIKKNYFNASIHDQEDEEVQQNLLHLQLQDHMSYQQVHDHQDEVQQQELLQDHQTQQVNDHR